MNFSIGDEAPEEFQSSDNCSTPIHHNENYVDDSEDFAKKTLPTAPDEIKQQQNQHHYEQQETQQQKLFSTNTYRPKTGMLSRKTHDRRKYHAHRDQTFESEDTHEISFSHKVDPLEQGGMSGKGNKYDEFHDESFGGENNNDGVSIEGAHENVERTNETDSNDGHRQRLNAIINELDGHLGVSIAKSSIESTTTLRSRLTLLWKKVLHCICPCFDVLRALCRCDMNTFWRIIPSIFVVKALWLAFLTIGVCDLGRVYRVKSIATNVDNINLSDTFVEAYNFGLWTYSDNLNRTYAVDNILKEEYERVQQCKFNMKHVDNGAPDDLFLDDACFQIARAFAIITAFLGSISLIFLWCTAAKARGTGTKIMRAMLGSSLMLCCIFQSFVFLVFASSVCRDTIYMENRHCTLQEGSGCIIGSSIFWALTSIASFKMPLLETANTLLQDFDLELHDASNHDNSNFGDELGERHLKVLNAEIA